MTGARRASALTGVAARLLGTRWLMRIPIVLYRARLGFLLGGRFLLLEHRGRVSGRRRRVVLEVIGRPFRGSYLVVSGFGTRAQWYRNIRATPAVRVTTGIRGPRPARASFLAGEEATAALRAYADAHPRAWASFGPILDTTLGAPALSVPVVRLDLESR